MWLYSVKYSEYRRKEQWQQCLQKYWRHNLQRQRQAPWDIALNAVEWLTKLIAGTRLSTVVTSYKEQPYPIQKAIIILSKNKNENKENRKIRVLLTACFVYRKWLHTLWQCWIAEVKRIYHVSVVDSIHFDIRERSCCTCRCRDLV